MAVVVLLLAGAAQTAAVRLQPYADAEGSFRILRPVGWRVHRALDVGMVVFYRDDPFRGARFVVLPELPVRGRLTVPQAARILLVEFLPVGKQPAFRWHLTREDAERGEGEARWRETSSNTRMLFWLRILYGGSDVTGLELLAGLAPEAEFRPLLSLFRAMRASYTSGRARR